jgi:ketosteroid isomerase-like protein
MTSDRAHGPAAFMAAYQQAASSHDLDRVMRMIAADATYWFTDGSYRGLAEIRAAIEQTFAVIQDEVYEISDLQWAVLAAEHAVCHYRFWWRGIVDGQIRSGQGRGTNVLVLQDGMWKIKHEHLSP